MIKHAHKANHPKLLSFLSAAALLLAVVNAGATEIVPIAKQKFEMTRFADKPGLRVYVEQPMTLKLGGAFGLMGYRWVVEDGTYRDVRQMKVAGREVVLLPVKMELFGKPPSRGSAPGSSIGACYTPDGHFVALDVATGDVLQRGLLRNKVAANCGGGARLDWAYTVSAIVDEGVVKIRWGQDLVDAETRQVETQLQSTAVAEQLKDTATQTAKSQIGARICMTQAGIQYVGYTEAVSPDNGKLQIRIADAMVGGHGGLRPGGFQPSILWDSPDRWDICE